MRKRVSCTVALAVGASAYAYGKRRRKRKPNLYLVTPDTVSGPVTPRMRTRIARGIYLPVLLFGLFLQTALAVPSILSDMFQGVYSVLRVIAQVVVDAVQTALDDFFAAVSEVLDALGAGLGFVRWGLSNLEASFSVLARQLYNEVFGYVDRLVDMLLWPIETAISAIRSSVSFLESTIPALVRSVFDSLYDTLIRPALDALTDMIAGALDFLSDPIGFIRREIENALDWIIDAVKDALFGAVDWFADMVRAALNYMIGGAVDVIDTIKAVWHYVVWVATHPEDAVRQLVRETVHSLTANDSAEFRSMIQSMMGEYEDALSDLLGIQR